MEDSESDEWSVTSKNSIKKNSIKKILFSLAKQFL